MTEPAELVEQVARAIDLEMAGAVVVRSYDRAVIELVSTALRRSAIAAIAAVRAYDEAQVEHLSAFLRAISIRPDEAEMQRADEPATERAPPADGWEAF